MHCYNSKYIFSGSVALAGAQTGLWAVKGGNRRVPEGLLKRSKANVMIGAVTKVVNATVDPSKPLYLVHLDNGSVKEYDVVVVAFPLVKGHTLMEFSGFQSDFTALQREYHSTKAILVEGVPNYKYFGYDNLDQMPGDIFPIGKKEIYSSIGELFPVNGVTTSPRVYKVFSNELLSDNQLDTLFLSRASTKLIEWLAYPQYSVDMDFAPFVLAPKLYYVNAIELAASAMEMSALAGVNIADLVTNEWMGHDHLVDNMFVIEEKHIKLEL